MEELLCAFIKKIKKIPIQKIDREYSQKCVFKKCALYF